jgi:periplasmic protein CpxP/Spy
MRKNVLARTMMVGVMALAAVAAAGAQEPGPGGPGAGGPGFGPGFGGHRSPMERALGPMGAPQGRFWNNPTVVSKLNLTDDQRKGMDQVLQEHRTTLVDLHANLEKAELALEPMMKDDQPNESKILAQIDQVAQARANLEKANARFLLAIRAKLTPEQWKSLQELRTERMQERGARGFARHGQGPAQGGPGAPPPPQE